jgi:hypothetical protein
LRARARTRASLSRRLARSNAASQGRRPRRPAGRRRTRRPPSITHLARSSAPRPARTWLARPGARRRPARRGARRSSPCRDRRTSRHRRPCSRACHRSATAAPEVRSRATVVLEVRSPRSPLSASRCAACPDRPRSP